MDYFYLGAANIPVSALGGAINFISFYCLLKYRSTNILRYGNQERLLLALNISDLFFCLVALPFKIVTYMLNPVLPTKPLHIVYADGVYVWSSSLVIIFIAVSNYIKVSRPAKNDQILTKNRTIIVIVALYVYSIAGPAILFIKLQIFAFVNLGAFCFVMVALPLFYVLIVREMRASRMRTQTSPSQQSSPRNEKKVVLSLQELKSSGTDGKECQECGKNEHPQQLKIDGQISLSPPGVQNDQIQGLNKMKQISNKRLTIIERRVVKNVLILMVVYFGFSLTAIILIFLYTLVPGNQNKLDPVRYGVFIVSLKAIINPLIYVLKNKNYRKIAKKFLPRCLQRKGVTMNMNDSKENKKIKDFQDKSARKKSTSEV